MTITERPDTGPPSVYLKTAASIADRANAEDRGFTDAERADVIRLMAKATRGQR